MKNKDKDIEEMTSLPVKKLSIGTLFLYKPTMKCSPIFIEKLRGKIKVCLVINIQPCKESDRTDYDHWTDYDYAYNVKFLGALEISNTTVYEEEVGKILGKGKKS